MPIRPDWQTGTITLAANGTVVTGANTGWLSAGIQAGDTLKVKNLDAVIASVNSDTSITLAEPWTGGALAAGSAYRIRYQPDGSRLAAAVRDLVDKLASGNVDAFAALVGAANRLPYFTAAGQLALATFTATDRALLGNANLAAFWTSAGLAPPATIPDSLPPDKAFRRGNVLGTVAQSGGVPTGALIESYTNENGTYARWADGTQLCWSPNFAVDITSAVGSIYRGTAINWIYPASFAAAPNILAGNNGSADTHWATARPLMSQGQINAFSHTTVTGRGVSACAIGRWF